MHIVFILFSVPLIFLGCAQLAHRSRPSIHLSWTQRRKYQLLILAAPLIALGIGLSGLHDFVVRVCGLSEQFWYMGIVGLLSIMAFIAAASLLLSLIRLLVMQHTITKAAFEAPAGLQSCADKIAAQLTTRQTKVLIRNDQRPLALTWGVLRPNLLLSTWMMTQLDDEELSAVIAHEMAHVARRDFFFAWITTLLRDAFFYWPASRTAHSQIKHDNEFACDDLATQVTGQPLALASALTKIWDHALTHAKVDMGYSQALLGTQVADELENRIERLLACSDGTLPEFITTKSHFLSHLAVWSALMILVAMNVTLMLGPFGCESALALCQ